MTKRSQPPALGIEDFNSLPVLMSSIFNGASFADREKAAEEILARPETAKAVAK